MNNKLLELQANRIEHTLTSHRINARVTGGTVTPRWVRFQVLPAVGAKLSKIRGLSEELAAALDAPNCRISRQGATVAVEIPRDEPQPVRLLPLFHQLNDPPTQIPPLTAILGVAEDGAPLLIRLTSPDVAHILIAGTTGSGKTTLLQTIILSLATTNHPRTLAILLIDPQGTAFTSFTTPYTNLPHLARAVIRDLHQAAEALNSLLHLMDTRTGPDPRIVVIIDELADLLMVGGRPVQSALTRLTQRGRQVGIHVVAATQKPAASVLGPLIKANFPVRLVGKVTSASDARVATGYARTGAERLTGRGDFLAIAEGRVIRFQVAHVSPREIRDTVANLNHTQTTTTAPTIALPWPVNQIARAALTPTAPRTVSNQTSTARVTPTPTAPQIAPNQTQTLAHRLITSNLWPDRRNGDSYRWGFLSAACRFLFDRDLEGTWDRQTRRVLDLAETISTTTAPTPNTGPQGGHIPPKE